MVLDRERALALTAYWRDVTISRALTAVEGPSPVPAALTREDGETSAWIAPLDLDAFSEGAAPSDFAFALVDEWERTPRRRRPVDGPPLFDAHCAPFGILSPELERPIYPLVANVAVSAAARLCVRARQGAFPPAAWIPRRHFSGERSDIPQALQFSNYADVIQLLFSQEGYGEWHDVVSVALALWQTAAGADLYRWVAALPPSLLFTPGWIRSGACEAFASARIWAYGEIHSRIAFGRAPMAYERLIFGERQPLHECTETLAVMSGGRGLLAGQRTAALAGSVGKPGDIVAVNGPPGTGKTTISQAVIADYVVRSNLRGRSPVILASAATNQAVTNILEALSRAKPTVEHPLFDRWIEAWEPYGVYAKSPSRKARVRPFPIVTYRHEDYAALSPEYDSEFYTRWTGRYDYDARTYIEVVRELVGSRRLAGEEVSAAMLLTLARANGTEFWLARYRAAFPTDCEIPINEALDRLHDALRETRGAANAARQLVSRGEDARTVASFVASSCSDVFGADMSTWLPYVLDIFAEEEQRHSKEDPQDAQVASCEALLGAISFALASRIAEGRFAVEIESGSAVKYGDRACADAALRFIANVAPCIVATFDRLPMVARRWNVRSSRWQLAYEVADLMMIDEAGQASSDKAAFAFALGERVLVLGDVKQLPPIDESDAPAFDETLAHFHKVATREIAERGLLSTASPAPGLNASIMYAGAIATTADCGSRIGPGIWLFDHFRCQKQIIDFCSAHWYDSRLRCRTPVDDALFPLVYVPVYGNDVSAGGSRVNPIEADAIAEWCASYREFIEGTCERRLEDAVGIVTPFRAQAAAVRKVLRESLREIDLAAMVCDTVHSLQGAERDVVLLSLVYAPSGTYRSFLDVNETLLNVAVSRARRCLIVFAHPNALLYAMPGGATARLRAHLVAHAEGGGILCEADHSMPRPA